MNGTHTSELVGIARAFNLPDAEYSELRKRADKLLEKAMAYGFSAEQLELIYVPARSECDFDSLLKKLQQVRKEQGCRWDNEWRWKELWTDMARVFGDYGIRDEAKLFVLLHGPKQDGLFYTNKTIGEREYRTQ